MTRGERDGEARRREIKGKLSVIRTKVQSSSLFVNALGSFHRKIEEDEGAKRQKAGSKIEKKIFFNSLTSNFIP